MLSILVREEAGWIRYYGVGLLVGRGEFGRRSAGEHPHQFAEERSDVTPGEFDSIGRAVDAQGEEAIRS